MANPEWENYRTGGPEWWQMDADWWKQPLPPAEWDESLTGPEYWMFKADADLHPHHPDRRMR